MGVRARADVSGSHVMAELGPMLPPIGELRAQACEAHQLVLILLDVTGPGGDHLRAARTMDKLRALIGPPAEGDGRG